MVQGDARNGEQDGRALFDGLTPLTVAAHELKAPLALIRQLSLELAESGDAPTLQRQLIEQIQLVSEQSLRLTTNLTKASYAQSSLFATEPLNVVQLYREVTQEIKPLYRAHARTLTTKHNTRLPAVVANRDLLKRIMLSFADNALHYANEDGAVELYSQLVDNRRMVRLAIRDYGPKLPADAWKRLLSGNAPRIASDRPNSSGLGLMIAGQFASSIGGKIGAIRHRDGASFYVDVPVSKQLSLL